MDWLQFATFLLIFTSNVVDIYSESNTDQTKCTSDDCESSNSVLLDYVHEKKEEWAKYISLIEEAAKNYKPCSSECSCYDEQVEKDLLPFKKGIKLTDVESAIDRGTLYQIIDHKLYRDKNCMFPSRCKGVEHFILEIIHELPNMDFVVNTRDWPQVSSYDKKNMNKPVFSFSKTKAQLDIMYPAWSFWEGGPAIRTYPTGIGRWDLLRKSLISESDKWPWSKKKSKGFFRGSRTNNERDNLILLSRNEPKLVDAKLTKNQAWKSMEDTLNSQPAEIVSFEAHCKYKYLFNYRGVAASFRLKHLFMCGSLVFHVGKDYDEFFYFKLVPWFHYIPVRSFASEDEIKDLILFAQYNDEVVSTIASNGFNFIKDYLTMESISCYWKKLLSSYAKLLSYTPKKRKDLIEIVQNIF